MVLIRQGFAVAMVQGKKDDLKLLILPVICTGYPAF
jgi:hypothetical protein